MLSTLDDAGRYVPRCGNCNRCLGRQASWTGFGIPCALRYGFVVSHMQRISVDPAIRFGKPCVRGTRITVGEVLGFLAGGASEAELIADFPQLTHEDVLACLGFAAERERRLLILPAA